MTPPESAALPHLDRALQRTILEGLETRYPGRAQCRELGFEPINMVWVRNVTYLAEHGLVALQSASASAVIYATITAKGLDFLQADGGLGAILNVLTVRFDAETLRAMLGARIAASGLPHEEKSKLLDWLKKVGKDGLEKAASKLFDAALDHLPDAVQLLQRLPSLVT